MELPDNNFHFYLDNVDSYEDSDDTKSSENTEDNVPSNEWGVGCFGNFKFNEDVGLTQKL